MACMLSLADIGRSSHRPPFPNPGDYPRILLLRPRALGMKIVNTEKISRRMIRCWVSGAKNMQVHLGGGHSQSPIPACQVSSVRLFAFNARVTVLRQPSSLKFYSRVRALKFPYSVPLTLIPSFHELESSTPSLISSCFDCDVRYFP